MTSKKSATKAVRLTKKSADLDAVRSSRIEKALGVVEPNATAARLTKKSSAAVKRAVGPLEQISPAVVKATKKLLKPKKPAVNEAPVTPLTKLLTKAGYVYVASQPVDELNIAHGYNHPSGAAALFTHANVNTEVGAAWTLKAADGTERTGKTAKELAAVLTPSPVASLPANVATALTLLRKLTTLTLEERKAEEPVSKTTYRLTDLAGDGNYKARLQLLKALRQTDKVLVKESGVNNLIKEFYATLNIEKASVAAMASAFEAKCNELYKGAKKADEVLKTVDKAVAKEVLKKTAHERVVIDNKPILPGVKRLSAKKQAAVEAKDKEAIAVDFAAKGVGPLANLTAEETALAPELAARIARKRRQEEYTPLAVPRPEAEVALDLAEVCLLEDPENGIVIMCLEKPNSQGAICVYNNGSRVAAGVVPTERLITLRRLVSEDLIRDVNLMLHPLTNIPVTPVAEQHLTAVLNHCKENIEMTTETAVVKTKKFAPPVTASKKAVAAEKPAKTAAKGAKAPKAEKTAAAPRVTADKKIKALVTLKSEGLPRAGSFCYGQVQSVIGSKTVAEAQAKLDASGLNPNGRKLEVAWLAKNGFIEVAA